ncbi:MAG: DUF5777 family beta-barrel protein [Cyclobacteriaceae bacterium]
MKTNRIIIYEKLGSLLVLGMLFILANLSAYAQDEADSVVEQTAPKPIRDTFESAWLIDNQSVMVPAKGTLEMDIMHRFGTVDKGYDNFFGIYAPSNIRIGMSYAPIRNLNVGFGFSKIQLTWDFNAKYALLQQMESGGWPVSITYFGNIAIDTRSKENFVNESDRLSYFNQIIFARKVTANFSVQVAPSLSHFNALEGYVNEDGQIRSKLKNDHFAIAFGGRYKITPAMAVMLNYDQPITQHYINNPHPNISFGIEVNTSAHAFQVFVTNYYNIIPQLNNLFNQNDLNDGQFLIGFNITRLWSF